MPTYRFDKRAIAAVVLLGALCAPTLFAQPPRSDPRSSLDQVRPPEPPAGFVPAGSLPTQEQLPAAPLVIAAYAVAWVAVFGYLWSIWQRLGRVERELADVSRRISSGQRR